MEMIINKEKLPHGAIAEIAKRAQVAYTTAFRTVEGRGHNRKVLEALAAYLRELNHTEEEIRTLASKIK